MSLDLQPTPTIGDNSNDPHALAMADIEQRLAAFVQGADVWEKRKPEEMDEDLAARANDYLTGTRKLWKDADNARAAEKAPHLAASRDVDAKWKTVLAKIEKLAPIVKPLIEAHLKREQERKAKERADAERIAREAEDAARAAREEAASAQSVTERLEAEERAEQEEARADHAAEVAAVASEKAKATSATGLANNRSLRTKRTPRITSWPAAINFYRAEPELTDLLLRFAARDLRNCPVVDGEKTIPTIPGIAWDETQEL